MPRQPALDNQELVRLAFDHGQIGSLTDRGLHRGGIKLAIRLGARPPNGRTLATIEHAKLDTPGIGNAAHQSVERIDLSDQMALAQTTDGRIAGHRADGRKAVRHQRGSAHPSARRTRSLTAGMAAANDDDVV